MPESERPKKASGIGADPQIESEQPITEDLEGLPFNDPTRLLGLKDAVLSGWFLSHSNEIFKGVPISADDAVVDVGCGDGGALSFCAKRGAHLIAVDADPRNIENVRQRLQGSNARQVDCHVSTSNPLPLADESVTRVICTEVLEHVDDPVQVLGELHRIGKPGALYVLSVPDPLQENLQKLVAPPSYFRKPNHVRIIDRDEFEHLVRGAGLEILSHDYVGFFWSIWFAFYSPRHWPDDARILPIHDDPLLKQWELTWKTLLDSEGGPELKRKLDSFMPKSQVIVARKP